LLIITNILVFCEGLLGVASLNGCELFQRINIKELLLLNNVEEALNKLLSESLIGDREEVPDYKL
jgi:hypothetical protein